MAKAVVSSSVVTSAKMTPPSITLLPDKKSPTNSHSSPARTGKNTPTNTEKKAHMNGHASPSHLAGNISSSHGGKPILEGYMKTDDRMRLAKERREERERSLVAREQLIREKERRARLQYERTVEERWRRLEEQRLKEDLRRAAVEEKRRQKLEEERERFEALMKRSLERSLQLEQRTKRWGRGCHPGAGDCENAPLPFSAASAFSHGIASPFPAVSESAPCSPHRSPFHSSVNHTDHKAGLQGGSQSTPNTPKKERLRRERRTASPGYGSPVRRSESPASITKHLASPTASKLASKIRAQSPRNAHQYHYSPTRQRPSLSDDRKAENGKVGKKDEQTKAETAAKKNADINSLNSSPPVQKNMLSAELAKTKFSNTHLKGDTADKNQSPERRNQMASKGDSSEKKTQSNLQDGDKKKEPVSCTGKVAAGTSDAEEASRLLAERRRQARAQKELEEKQREQEKEEERLREEQLRKQLAQVQQRRETMNQQVKEKAKSEEDPHLKEEEEKQKKEQQEKELQAQMEREREKAKVQAQEDVERQRQDRELQTQQEEEERLQRKKRIEEIMKRTRKSESESKTEEQVETKSVSPQGDKKTVQSNAQVKEQVTVEIKTKDSALGKTEAAAAAAAAAQMDSQKQVKNNTHLMMHSVPEKESEKKQTSAVISSLPKVAKACVLKQEGTEVGINVNQQHRVSVNVTEQIKKEPTKLKGEGGMMNNGGKGDPRAEVSKQQSVDALAAGVKEKEGSQVEVVRPPVAPLPIRNLSPPIIKLEPLDVTHTGSCDEVQSMEVSPASKEELISIPEYSPVNEIQSNGMSNTRALEELMDLTGSITYVKLSTESTVGDCNKNLIEGVVSPVSDSQLTGVAPPSSNKLSIK